MINPLVHRIVGSKQAHLQLWETVLTAHPYKISYEPYAGGLTVSNYLLQLDNPTLETVVCAEIDPSLQGLYKAWSDRSLRSDMLSQFKDWQRYPAQTVLKRLKRKFEQVWNDQDPNYIEAAVAGLLLRYTAHNGKLAPNASSETLNITFSDQQLAKWGAFDYQFPPAPENLYLYQKSNLIDWVLHADQPSIGIVDPPYVGNVGHVKYRDPDFIRPVYFKHQPHARETYNLAVFPVEEALSNNVTVAIACNYYSDRLHEDYESLANDYDYRVFNFEGVPPKLNNGGKTNKEPYYQDSSWVFCKLDDPLVRVLSNPGIN